MSNCELQRIANLKRLLAPEHIVFIGGRDADYAARQCARRFKGTVSGVNPKRSEMGGQPCYPTVQDLPQVPDAVFLATPREAALKTVADLNGIGAGGVACFTAGYGETGPAGIKSEQKLVQAAGNMALVGPNCYGVINYVHDAILWPFGAGAHKCRKGAALIMQSGMITADMAMNQRSVPLAYVISVGNQAMLAVEDYMDVLIDDPQVSVFGIYVEGIIHLEKFAAACLKALFAGKPILLLKAGSSSIGASLAVSHTGSLSGADEAHQALFDLFGVIRVRSPELMLEALKFMTISGIPEGRRIAAFTCSGGEALMVADYCERNGLELPQPSESTVQKLAELLPDIATISNPLDYTTPLWGNREVMPKVFAAALEDGPDAAVFIQDYPPAEFDANNALYRADGKSFMDAVNAAGIPAGICSELSENFDLESREIYAGGGVTPMQGFDRGLDALVLACEYHHNRERILTNSQRGEFRIIKAATQLQAPPLLPRSLNEWESKRMLSKFGLQVPVGRYLPIPQISQAAAVAGQIGFPVVVKLVADDLIHKTELNVVVPNLTSRESVRAAVGHIRTVMANNCLEQKSHGLLIESMVGNAVHELLVGVQSDPQFGLTMVIASGGILVELYKDSQTVLLPTDAGTVIQALSRLKCHPLLCGYRGRAHCDIGKLVDTIMKIAEFAESNSGDLVEMDVNPLMVLPDGAIVADALIRMRR